MRARAMARAMARARARQEDLQARLGMTSLLVDVSGKHSQDNERCCHILPAHRGTKGVKMRHINIYIYIYIYIHIYNTLCMKTSRYTR